MKYVCLEYCTQTGISPLQSSHDTARAQQGGEYFQSLHRKGQLLASKSASPPGEVVTLTGPSATISLRPHLQRLNPTNLDHEPSLPTTLAGILLLEAVDLNHAIQIMSQHPALQSSGWLEIHPMRELS